MPKKFKTIAQQRGISKDSNYFLGFTRFSRKVREKIHKLRCENGLTQEQMEDFELNLRQFQRIECGDTSNITLSYLYRIAAALGVTPSELIDV